MNNIVLKVTRQIKEEATHFGLNYSSFCQENTKANSTDNYLVDIKDVYFN